jgi:pSer/pThr/pTyr-binding forkhead associated (FHA) protein
MDLLLLGLRLLAAAILYAFLAALLVMLWRDLQGAADRREATHPSARLIVLETTERVLEAGTAFVLQRVTSVGRGPGNTISIPDSFVSGHHALLSWRGSQWWLEDQGSRNGTLLNGVPVGRPTVITAGDIVGVGRTEFKLEMDDGSRASE